MCWAPTCSNEYGNCLFITCESAAVNWASCLSINSPDWLSTPYRVDSVTTYLLCPWYGLLQSLGPPLNISQIQMLKLPNFHCLLPVAVFLWWCYDTSCTSGFVDDVIFAHYGRLPVTQKGCVLKITRKHVFDTVVSLHRLAAVGWRLMFTTVYCLSIWFI